MGQPVLKRGDRGDAVRQLQSLVGARVDGAFGRRTEALLRATQLEYGIAADGVCGPATWNVLGWLPGAIRLGPTRHRYHLGKRPHLIRPVEAVVLHYTASPRGDGEQGTDYERMARWAQGGRRVSSTHLIILRDGRIIQMAPLFDRTWHAPFKSRGRISNALEIEGRQLSPNLHGVGVDFENVGWLKREGGRLVNAYGGTYDGPQPFLDNRGRPWEPYTAAQMSALQRVLTELAQRFPVLSSDPEARVVGHSNINHQGSRVDPGPALSMPWARDIVSRAGREAA